MCHGAVLVMCGPNAQVQRRRSTEGAQGTNTGHKNGEAMARVGVRCNAQLGLWIGARLDAKLSLVGDATDFLQGDVLLLVATRDDKF